MNTHALLSVILLAILPSTICIAQQCGDILGLKVAHVAATPGDMKLCQQAHPTLPSPQGEGKLTSFLIGHEGVLWKRHHVFFVRRIPRMSFVVAACRAHHEKVAVRRPGMSGFLEPDSLIAATPRT